MLGNAWHWQKVNLKLDILRVIKGKNIYSLIYYLLPLWLLSKPAIAAETVLGVVQSRENTRQWTEISNRLEQVGVNYCIVNASDWREELDLGNIQVLLLPNVEILTGKQAGVLEQWMSRGGKVIVTGPTGNLSQPQVRSQLRSLFGGYWGFSLSTPATIALSATTPLEWSGRNQLSHTFVGGAVIPSSTNSQTAAFWLAEDNPPAAIVTNNSTVLGWRWGFDAVAPNHVDTAWLQAALNRYGISTYGRFVSETVKEPTACRPSILPSRELRPLLPHWQQPNSAPLPESRFNFRRDSTINLGDLETMERELAGLIARFESTLLTADANQSQIDLSTSKVVEQLLSNQAQGNKSLSTDLIGNKSLSRHQDAHQALAEAREKQKKFQRLAAQQDFPQARIKWLDARRILWDNYPTDRQLAQPEIRAIWLDRGTIVRADSESDLAIIFDRLAKAGINTVFFETLNAGYPIYPSRIAPQQNPLVRGWDPLKAAIKLAHERDIELHAWVWTFATANQRHNVILNLPKDYPGPVLSRYPDWAISDRQGNQFHYHSGKAFLDPANPAVRRYLSLLLEEIATQYDVDGIHLDYIRYPFQSADQTKTYGYGIAARQQFQQMTGVDPITLTPSSPLWSQWTGFRIKQIDSFVASVSQQLKQERPHLTISTAVFPLARGQRLNQIQQHWEEWTRQDWIDLLVPMTYATNTDELDKLASPLFEDWTETTTLLLPGIRLLNLPDAVAVDQMQLLRGMSAGGFAFFAAENFNPRLQQIFSRTQGSKSTTSKEPLPHRQPFQATQFRYQALQREWNFLLANDRISLSETTMKELGKQADELAASFQQLADEPSTKHLLSARLSLSTFQRKFPRWLAETDTIGSYQIEVWQNRLTALDKLLSYGEKRILNSEKYRSVQHNYNY